MRCERNRERRLACLGTTANTAPIFRKMFHSENVTGEIAFIVLARVGPANVEYFWGHTHTHNQKDVTHLPQTETSSTTLKVKVY